MKSSPVREFRSAVARLKKAGLVSPDIDARSVQPTRALKDAVRRFRSVVRNEAGTLRASRVNLPRETVLQSGAFFARAKGQPVRIVVPKHKDETVRVGRGGSIDVKNKKAGVRRIDVHGDISGTPAEFLRSIKGQIPKGIPGVRYGARYHGGYTYLHDTPEVLFRTLMDYQSITGGDLDDIRSLSLYIIEGREGRDEWELEKEFRASKKRPMTREQKDRANARRRAARQRSKKR